MVIKPYLAKADGLIIIKGVYKRLLPAFARGGGIMRMYAVCAVYEAMVFAKRKRFFKIGACAGNVHYKRRSAGGQPPDKRCPVSIKAFVSQMCMSIKVPHSISSIIISSKYSPFMRRCSFLRPHSEKPKRLYSFIARSLSALTSRHSL